MRKKKITIQDAMNHADDIDVYSALQQFSPHKSITRAGLQNIYDFSHAAKNHQSTKPFIKKAGLNSTYSISLPQLIKAEIK